jgi:capsular polysaccharide export protein
MIKHWLPRPGTRLGATFYVRKSQPWLSQYFGIDRLEPTLSPGIAGVVLWGGRIPAKAARAIATLRGLPSWYLEDGFLRSVGLGKQNVLPVSIQVDDLGMPVDASRPSRLEALISASAGMDLGALGADIRASLVRERLSKYNNLPHRPPKLDATTRRRVLLVDQVFGDVSVPMAGGSQASFRQMLDDAVASGAQCVVRTHPDVMAGFRKGYLTEQARETQGVLVTAEPVSVASMLDVVDEVWTVSSQMGLDALIRGIPARCYAAPSYAGWGLTDDRFERSSVVTMRRKARPSVNQLVAAAFSLYPCYRDTTNWQEIDVFRAIETLAGERRQLNVD